MSLIKSVQLSQLLLRNNKILINATRNHWNKDYKPLPFPTTKEERLAAAKKYGLHPLEYETYPDDGTGYGDYPKLPFESVESRDPYYPWDNPEYKRNFNEPIHVNYELLREDRYDVSVKLRQPLWLYPVQFLAVFLGLFTVYYVLEDYKMFHPLVPPQLPQEGKVHYTFEPKK